MLTNEKRGTIIENLLLHMRENEGREEVFTGDFKKYSIGLSLCSVDITLDEKLRDSPIIVNLKENFGRPKAIQLDKKAEAFDGFRLYFRGSKNGLDEVMLYGVHLPEADGSVGLPSERLLLHSSDSGIASSYETEFDRYLLYIAKELKLPLE